MNSQRITRRTVASLLRLAAAQAALLLACQGALAAGAAGTAALLDAVVDEPATSGDTQGAAAASPAAQLVALTLREAGARRAAAPSRGPRIGLHYVVRLAVMDVVSHPASGEVDFALRSRLLNRSIARAPLAVGIAWRF